MTSQCGVSAATVAQLVTLAVIQELVEAKFDSDMWPGMLSELELR